MIYSSAFYTFAEGISVFQFYQSHKPRRKKKEDQHRYGGYDFIHLDYSRVLSRLPNYYI